MDQAEPDKDPRSTPGKRALSAMALAAQRARQSAVVGASDPQPAETQRPETQRPETQRPETQRPETQRPETQRPETHPAGTWHEQLGPVWSDASERAWRTGSSSQSTGEIRAAAATARWRLWDKDVRAERAVRSGAIATGALVAVLSVVVIALNAFGGPGSPAPSPPAGHPAGGSSPARSPAPAKGSSSGSGSSPTSPPGSSTTLPATSETGGAPEITSIAPSSGTAGQTVTLSGSDFFSPDGQIQAYFGGAQAPTSCPVQTTCTVTVPNLPGGPASVPVRVITQAGSSNTLTFEYS